MRARRGPAALRAAEELILGEGLIPQGSRVLCAVSGGADSVCLLAVLYRLRERLGFDLAAAHYNHQLRGAESCRDETFVRELVRDRFPGVALYVGRGDVAQAASVQGTGLEETARRMRYAFLQETAERAGCGRIATAHTADDNAETIVLHLARGTGLQGLTGIAPGRDKLIRPLLTATRAEVEDFLTENGLPHVEDSTNTDDAYARNRVRHQVIPVLEGLYPGFARRLTENAEHLRADEAYLSAQAERLTRQAERTPEGLVLPAAVLADAPRPIALRAVRRLLADLRDGEDTCRTAHLEDVLALCGAASPSGEVHLPGDLTARREYDRLYLCRQGARPELCPMPLEQPGVTRAGEWTIRCVPAVYGGERQSGLDCWLSCERAASLWVRPRQTGDALKLPGRPGKTVKKWLVEEKIPRRDRELLPVLAVEDRVAAVARLGPDADFVPEPGEEAWHVIFVPLKM